MEDKAGCRDLFFGLLTMAIIIGCTIAGFIYKMNVWLYFGIIALLLIPLALYWRKASKK